MQVGIGSWTYPWAIGVPGHSAPPVPLTAQDLLHRAHNLNLDVLQIADNLPLHTLNAADLNDLQSKAAASGIALEAGTRGTEPPHLLRYLAIAQCLGAKLLRTLTHTQASREGLDQVEIRLREVLPEFEAAGVSIAIETYERHTARDIANLIERIGSPSLGVCLDTINSLGILEMPSQVLDTLGAYVINVHAKDFVIRRTDTMMGYDVRGCPAGEGQMALDVILAKIASYGRSPSVILEQWPPFQDSVPETILLEEKWAELGVGYLKKLR